MIKRKIINKENKIKIPQLHRFDLCNWVCAAGQTCAAGQLKFITKILSCCTGQTCASKKPVQAKTCADNFFYFSKNRFLNFSISFLISVLYFSQPSTHSLQPFSPPIISNIKFLTVTEGKFFFPK